MKALIAIAATLVAAVRGRGNGSHPGGGNPS